MSVIDHKTQAQSRVYAQYRDKPKLMAWIGVNGELGNEIEAVYQDVLDSYNIDTASTDELDVLGRIVVISRSFEAVDLAHSYLWGAAQFGAAQFRPGAGTTDQELNNEVYRLLIRAKISKNTNHATLDGIITALSFILTTDFIRVLDPEDMSFSLVFDVLTDLERVILGAFDLIPKPQGVRYSGYEELAAVTQFNRNQFGSSQFAYQYEA